MPLDSKINQKLAINHSFQHAGTPSRPSTTDNHWRVTVPDCGPAQQAFAAFAADPYFNPA